MVCPAARGSDPVDLDAMGGLLGLGEVVLHLQTEPDLRTAAEGLGQPYGHLGGNASPAIDEVVEGLALHTKAGGCIGNGEAQGLDALLSDDPAGVRGVLHGHGLSSVVVDQVDVVRVAVVKVEDDAPVGPDSHAAKAFEVTLEGVEVKAGQVHIFGLLGAVQHGEDVFYFLDVIGPESFGFAVLEEPLDRGSYR